MTPLIASAPRLRSIIAFSAWAIPVDHDADALGGFTWGTP